VFIRSSVPDFEQVGIIKQIMNLNNLDFPATALVGNMASGRGSPKPVIPRENAASRLVRCVPARLRTKT
jgi:hypothetical protein